MRLLRLTGTCLIVLLAGVCTLAPAQSSRSERARAELDALRDKIETVRRQIAADTSERGDLSAKLAATENDIDAARQRLEDIAHRIDVHEQRIATLTDKRDAERADLADKLQALRRQVRAAYRSGHMSRMRLLLSGESPERMGRMLAYYGYFADAQSARVADLKSSLNELASRQRALESEKAALAGQRDDRKAVLARLEDSRNQRHSMIASLDRQLSQRKASLKDMRADKQRLQDLLDSLSKQLADLPKPSGGHADFASLKGRMQAPVAGRTLARYGSLKAGGPLRWQGEWLAAATGTPIRAVAAGRVVYVGYMHRYGLIVILDHGHNYYTLYGHAESADVSVGDHVKRGQAIARAGHSGGHRRSGTYFEIRKGSTPVNPAHWLSG